jgi:GTP cyclohydrolase I
MRLDELYVVGPIAVRSCCAHHLCPIEGSAWCGIIPSERVIGVSKFSRLADWVLSRPQIQEEAVMQLADLLESAMGRPQGLAVVIKARHTCMTWRGVRDASTMMTTSVMRGIFQHGHAARAEFFSIVNNGGVK